MTGKLYFGVVLVCVVAWACSAAFAQSDAATAVIAADAFAEGTAVPVTTSPITSVQIVEIKGTPRLSLVKVGKRLSFRERRRLGATFVNVRRVLRDLEASGELDYEDPDGIAPQVMQRLIEEKPEEFKRVAAGRDWASFFDAFLAFLEKILPIIMQFFSFADGSASAYGPLYGGLWPTVAPVPCLQMAA